MGYLIPAVRRMVLRGEGDLPNELLAMAMFCDTMFVGHSYGREHIRPSDEEDLSEKQLAVCKTKGFRGEDTFLDFDVYVDETCWAVHFDFYEGRMGTPDHAERLAAKIGGKITEVVIRPVVDFKGESQEDWDKFAARIVADETDRYQGPTEWFCHEVPAAAAYQHMDYTEGKIKAVPLFE